MPWKIVVLAVLNFFITFIFFCQPRLFSYKSMIGGLTIVYSKFSYRPVRFTIKKILYLETSWTTTVNSPTSDAMWKFGHMPGCCVVPKTTKIFCGIFSTKKKFDRSFYIFSWKKKVELHFSDKNKMVWHHGKEHEFFSRNCYFVNFDAFAFKFEKLVEAFKNN